MGFTKLCTLEHHQGTGELAHRAWQTSTSDKFHQDTFIIELMYVVMPSITLKREREYKLNKF